MSDEDWDVEALKAFASLMRGLYEDDVIRRAELGLVTTADLTHIPMPMTAHRSLERYAGRVRKGGPKDYYINIPYYNRVTPFMMTEPFPMTSLEKTKTVLTQKKFMAPAPFVGDPRVNEAAYMWRAWVDDVGRHIAGEAELIWRY